MCASTFSDSFFPSSCSYNEGEVIDAILLSTVTAKHQIVWVDEFERATTRLNEAWENARKVERADDPLPVSLILNPEFASLTASSNESSPRGRSSSLGQVAQLVRGELFVCP